MNPAMKSLNVPQRFMRKVGVNSVGELPMAFAPFAVELRVVNVRDKDAIETSIRRSGLQALGHTVRLLPPSYVKRCCYPLSPASTMTLRPVLHIFGCRYDRRATRTTNLLERLFLEERRRLKIIPNGFGEKPVLKLMFGALVRAAERWRGLRFTEFELRHIAAIRDDLDAEYDAKVTRSGKSSQPRFSSKSVP
jgi:hypothetical protein